MSKAILVVATIKGVLADESLMEIVIVIDASYEIEAKNPNLSAKLFVMSLLNQKNAA